MVLSALHFCVSETVDVLVRFYQLAETAIDGSPLVLRTELHSPEGTGPCVAGDRALRRHVGTWSMPGPLSKWPLGREQERKSLDVKLNRHVSNPWSSPPI